MRSLAEHLQMVMGRVRPLEPLAPPLLDANGCVLAADVEAPSDAGFHSSAVVGYAARAADIAMASPQAVLPVREPRSASQVSPGCVAGRGGDAASLRQRLCDPCGVHRPRRPDRPRGPRGGACRECVRPEARSGRAPLCSPSGRRWDREIALLAAVGIGKVPAYLRPRIAVLTTGTELIDTGRIRPVPVGPMSKPDINGVSLACAVVEAGALSYRVGPVADDPVRLRKILDDQLGRADMVVTTGGSAPNPTMSSVRCSRPWAP